MKKLLTIFLVVVSHKLEDIVVNVTVVVDVGFYPPVVVVRIEQRMTEKETALKSMCLFRKGVKLVVEDLTPPPHTERDIQTHTCTYDGSFRWMHKEYPSEPARHAAQPQRFG